MESVTWYKLNQASQILFLKKALISSSVKILSVVFQEVTGSPHSFLRKISRFLMDNFDPCEHMQVSITSLQVILWRKKMRFCGGKSKLFQLATVSPKGLRWSQSSYSTAKVPHALSHAVMKNIKVRTEVGRKQLWVTLLIK